MVKTATKTLMLAMIGLLGLTAVPVPLSGQIFNDLGKLDPFVDLDQLAQEQAAAEGVVSTVTELPPLSSRPPGLAGLAISEVVVTGMAVGIDSKIAMLRGADNFTYLARQEARLYDGYISRISNEEVVFVRETFDPRGNRETTEVVKRIFTEED